MVSKHLNNTMAHCFALNIGHLLEQGSKSKWANQPFQSIFNMNASIH